MIICRHCQSDQAFKQQDSDKITWVRCPVCLDEERISNYFKKATSTKGLTKVQEPLFNMRVPLN